MKDPLNLLKYYGGNMKNYLTSFDKFTSLNTEIDKHKYKKLLKQFKKQSNIFLGTTGKKKDKNGIRLKRKHK